tara:strand:- start:8495 stop:9379 length:885 start_codon:yes stop_codon:yes gene_type:complete
MFFVTGIHRGGTTICGKIIALSKNVKYIHEPLNYKHGLKIADKWYKRFENLTEINELEKLSLNFKRGNQDKSFFYRLLSYIIPSKAYLSFLKLRFASFFKLKKKILIKDPFISLNIDLLTERNHKIIFIFRDPISFFKSIERKSWKNLPFDSLKNIKSNDLIRSYFKLLKNSKSTKLKSILFWGIYHEIVLELYKNSKKKNILIINHFDLIKYPYQISFEMLSFFDLHPNDKTFKFILSSFFNDKKMKLKNKTHVFNRSRKDMIQSTENNLSLFKNELKIVKKTYNSLINETIY